MAMALRNCGRDILFSACNWGAEESEKWIRSTGAHMYRATGDIRDSWQSIKSLALSQICKISHSGTYCFNDIDMLVVGMYGKSTNEHIANSDISACTDLDYRTHFAFWCMMNSPLMIGCDIRNMNEATKKILTNRDLIAINQDIEGRSPYYLGSTPETPREYFWMYKMLSNGDIALGVFNFSDKKRGMALQLFANLVGIFAWEIIFCIIRQKACAQFVYSYSFQARDFSRRKKISLKVSARTASGETILYSPIFSSPRLSTTLPSTCPFSTGA